MQMDHLPSRELETPNPTRSSFVVGVTRGFGGGGAEGSSLYPPSHYHALHLPGAGASAVPLASTVTPTIPKEERDPPSPPPPPSTLPLLDASGPASPPPAAAAINSCSIQKAVTALESSSYVYRECLRNHAASLGGNATDGCGEFTPGDVTDGAAADAALICSACGCHRNFHRKELANGGSSSHRYGHCPLAAYYPPAQHLTGTPGRKVVGQKGVLISTAAACTALVPYRQPPPPQPQPVAPTAMAVFPLHAVPAPLESDNEIDHADGGVGGPAVLGRVCPTNNVPSAPFLVTVPPGYGKKRFRTRFTPEQKKKMLAFAERIGWRLQRREEGEVQRFCQEIGVKRRVLKVWMHNNKHSRNINCSGGGGGIYSPTNEMIISNSSNDGGSGDVRDHHHAIHDKTVVHHDVTRNHDHHDSNTVVHHQVRSSHDHDDNGFAARIATTSPPPPHPQLPLHPPPPPASS